jgi:regulator of RNase E activity RraA
MAAHALSEDIGAVLRAVETSALSDVLDGIGLGRQVLAREFPASGAARRFCGRAACARVGAKPASGAPKSGDYFAEIDAMAAPQTVLVLQVAPSTGAVLGGFMAREFQRLGAVAVLTDGLVRDAAEIDGMRFAVFAAGVTPRNGARELQVESTGCTIALPAMVGGTVEISDGDWILGDDDGIVVVPAAVAADVANATRVLCDIERRIGVDMAQGMPRREAMRKHDRFAHLQPLRERLGKQA